MSILSVFKSDLKAQVIELELEVADLKRQISIESDRHSQMVYQRDFHANLQEATADKNRRLRRSLALVRKQRNGLKAEVDTHRRIMILALNQSKVVNPDPI